MRAVPPTAVFVAIFLVANLASVASPTPQELPSPPACSSPVTGSPMVGGDQAASLFAEIFGMAAPPRGLPTGPVFASTCPPPGCTCYDTTCVSCGGHFGAKICDIYNCPGGGQAYCNCGKCASPQVC
jgi:hypothetical protein